MSRLSAERMDFSGSLARRRHRPSHAKVLSTTRCRGISPNPLAVSDHRLTIPIVPASDLVQRPAQSGSSAGAIRKDVAQPGMGSADGVEHVNGAVTILNGSTVNDGADQAARAYR